ncbi:MAG: recombinase RecT [Ruminococcus sp.]|nr:recombinase RecT [Ruminococcus sp.]
MSNDIQKQNPTGIVTTTNPATVGFNFFDPVQFETMQRVCKMFASSDLVPDTYKPKTKPIPTNASPEAIAAIQAENRAAENKAIANCMIAVEVSMRIGASPLMVMQNMAVIYGRPSWSSKFLIATVNSCGRFEPLQFRFTNKGNIGKVEYTDYVWNDHTRRKEATKKTLDGTNIANLECVAYTTKKGSKDVLESAPVSIRLAIDERWYTKDGSKWQTMPRQMLMYRAASMWTNAYAPELSMGMRTVEEQQDIVDVEFEEIRDTPTESKTKEEAVKTTIGFDDATPAEPSTAVNQEAAPKETVDTETGEVTAAPAEDSSNDNPGF